MSAAPRHPAPPAAPTPAELDPIRRKVEHLFRYSLNEGHINPLMHLVLDYRAGRPQ